jgi:hypothetical protein
MTSRKTPIPTADLPGDLTSLGLRGIVPALDDLVARATRDRWGPRQVIEEACRLELADRAQRSLERRAHRARTGAFKAIDQFDWQWPTGAIHDPVGTDDRRLMRMAVRVA